MRSILKALLNLCLIGSGKRVTVASIARATTTGAKWITLETEDADAYYYSTIDLKSISTLYHGILRVRRYKEGEYRTGKIQMDPVQVKQREDAEKVRRAWEHQ